jgi:N-acetylglucosaminyl-diphospho-decaprenol L-rhamnosyltransferase
MDLTIGIVTYNGRALLARCLDSIYAAPPACRFEVVVVDNASADGTAEWLREVYPQVRAVPNTVNSGVARGNNQCLAAARGRYVLLLNNDTVVLPGMLDRLVAFADAHPDSGAVGGKLVNPDGSFQASYFDFPSLWSEFLHATHMGALVDPRYPSHVDSPEERPVDWIMSASLLVRRAASAQVGDVDESYFMYSDETDLQYRLHQAGWKVYYLPDVVTVHFGGQSASHWRRRKLIYRGKLLFFRKHYGPIRTALVQVLFGSISALKLAAWGPAWVALGAQPIRRERASNEIRSNVEVLRLSLRPE